MNRYFQEVLDAHQLIRAWLGDASTPSSVCDQLLTGFSSEYSMITLSGHRLDFNGLKAFFSSQRGAKPGLEIAIEQMELIAEGGSGAVVSYQERQWFPGQSNTLRHSTVVFEVSQEGKVLWRHLHETAIV